MARVDQGADSIHPPPPSSPFAPPYSTFYRAVRRATWLAQKQIDDARGTWGHSDFRTYVTAGVKFAGGFSFLGGEGLGARDGARVYDAAVCANSTEHDGDWVESVPRVSNVFIWNQGIR